MKILFLDIDGVLNSKQYDATRSMTDSFNIDESRLPLVKEIIDRTGARVVLSSSWRKKLYDDLRPKCGEGTRLLMTFEAASIPIYAITPCDCGLTSRPDEIRAWLSASGDKVEAYAILDDAFGGWGELSDRLVRTSYLSGRGLEDEHVCEAVRILNGEEYRITPKKSRRAGNTFDVSFYKDMQYLVSYPENYREGERFPTVILLHGAGSRGTDCYGIRRNDYFTITEQHEHFPFVTVAPICHGDTWFDLLETLKGFVDEIASSDFCDDSRLYAVGQSMGGYAVWQLGMSMPEYFAAIAPICGGGMYWNAKRLRKVPVWAFHGERDEVVLAEESVKMVNAVKAAGGDARLTLYPDCGHEAWVRAYSDYSLFEWLLTHTK